MGLRRTDVTSAFKAKTKRELSVPSREGRLRAKRHRWYYHMETWIRKLRLGACSGSHLQRGLQSPGPGCQNKRWANDATLPGPTGEINGMQKARQISLDTRP